MAKRSQRKKRDKYRDIPESGYSQKNPQQSKLQLEPATENQKTLIHCINMYAQTFALGPAGTGKTYVGAAMAADFMAQKQVKNIVVTRPNVPAGPTLGLFKGTLDEKVAEWAIPVFEVLKKALGASHVENLMKNGRIEFAPLETMRGRTFENSFVLLDEAQNLTAGQMEMFLTRIGKHSKVVVSGDVAQSDLGRVHSGLSKALQLVAKNDQLGDNIGVVEFDIDDVVRSGITGLWVKAFWADRPTHAVH